jgi:hypothetical protein
MWNLQNVVCVCRLSLVGGVFIEPWGSSTDMAEVVTHQVAVGWPCHMAGRQMSSVSTKFLQRHSLCLLVQTRAQEVLV